MPKLPKTTKTWDGYAFMPGFKVLTSGLVSYFILRLIIDHSSNCPSCWHLWHKRVTLHKVYCPQLAIENTFVVIKLLSGLLKGLYRVLTWPLTYDPWRQPIISSLAHINGITGILTEQRYPLQSAIKKFFKTIYSFMLSIRLLLELNIWNTWSWKFCWLLPK